MQVRQFHFSQNLRKSYREKLRINNCLVGIYSGGTSYTWQNLSDTIRLCNALYEQYPNYRLLVATPNFEINIAKNMVTKLINIVCLVLSLPHSEMNSLYCAADFAILLRKNHAMNIHSCPSKMGEYLGSELPVVTTANIGAFSSWLKNKPFSYFINDQILGKHDFASVCPRYTEFC